MADRATDWRLLYWEAVGHWLAFHRTGEAEQIAWGEMLLRWHRMHGGRPVPGWQCAGCGEPIRGLAALDLADGNRVHLDHLDCLLSFGEGWRNKATTGLRALGLAPPARRG